MNFKNTSIITTALSLLLLFSACSNEDDTNSTSETDIENNLISGTWRITKFIDSGVDETNDFNGYTFTFEASGVLSASNGSSSFEGSWNLGYDDSNDDDDDSDDLELTIIFNLTNDFEDLTDDWDFIRQTASRIELIDVSGGGEPDDLLTFERD